MNYLKINVINNFKGLFFSKLNFHPLTEIIIVDENQILINQKYKVRINSSSTKMKLDTYFYSPFYGKKEKSKCIIMEGKENINFDIS